MTRFLISIAVIAMLAINQPVAAQQAFAPLPAQPQRSPMVHPDPSRYRFNAATPEDAYRDGLINRWELEQLEGPTPQAMQGPSPNGNKGVEPGR
jgi:hypothetical protein